MDKDNLEIIKAAVVAVSKEAYNDLCKPVLQEVGGVFSTLIGLINHVLLYKPKTWIEKYKAKFNRYALEQQRQLNEIPLENRIEPPLNILTPAIEGITMNIDNDDLVNMFTNLLTSACDNRSNKYTHPSFVNIIKEMNSLDAQIFNIFATNYPYGKRLPVISPLAYYVNELDLIRLGFLPMWFTEIEIKGVSFFEISASFSRLLSRGLIENIDRRFPEETEKLSKHPFFIQRINYHNACMDKKIKLKYNQSAFRITEQGEQFAKICLKIKTSLDEVDLIDEEIKLLEITSEEFI